MSKRKTTKTTRVRGCAPYKPRPPRQRLINKVLEIIEENREVLPLTIRQIFYMLVSESFLPKTEKAYKNTLCETLNRARRAGMIEWDDIRDDGFTDTSPTFYQDTDHVWRTFHLMAKRFRFDRQAGQERRLQLWCEAAGMVPQLRRIADPYGIAVTSSGGFDGVTAKHTVGRDLAGQGPLTILHLGDLDPSGVHMFSSLDEDISAFADWYGGDVEFVRLAVTPEQVQEYGLPKAPPKKADKRSFKHKETTQCEALKPQVLAGIVSEQIKARIDRDLYDMVLYREMSARADIQKRLAAWDDQQ